MNWGLHIWGIWSKRKTSFYLTLIIPLLSITTVMGQVGINTTNPQEKLHIAGATGTLRVESLNSVNNAYNGGDWDNDGDMSNNTYPLYVDSNGDFTLELQTYLNTEASDALNDTELPTNSVTVTDNTLRGYNSTTIKTYTITLDRPTLLEIKFNISHHIYENNTYTPISDTLSRQVANWIEVTPDPDPNDGVSKRTYGICARTYTSGSVNSVTGPFYLGHTAYIKFEPTGSTQYTLKIMGSASSSFKAPLPGNPWNLYDSEWTYVEFATDYDFLFFRLY